ncbi:MAG: hypothetical protein ABL927_01950 [Bdellovibrionales bacterium]
MKSLLAIFAFIVLGFVSSAKADDHHNQPGSEHLTFDGGSIHAHLKWMQGPQSGEESILQLVWMNPAIHAPMAAPGEFKVVLWMPSMGHGSSPTKIEQSLDQKGQPKLGAYEISNIYFIMRGEWDVNVSLKLADGSEEIQTLHVTAN